MEKTVLTGKVAGEEEHHREDDQECDVRLQDSCDSEMEEVERGNRIIDEKERRKKQRKVGKGEKQKTGK